MISSIVINLRIFADWDVRFAQHPREDPRIETIETNGIHRIQRARGQKTAFSFKTAGWYALPESLLALGRRLGT